IAYIRVSTTAQRDEGSSLPAQRQRIEEWCRLHGHALVAVHADEGLSGGTIERRPGVQAAIAEACRRRCPLVCVSLSRLVRSTRDALEVAQRLDGPKRGSPDLAQRGYRHIQRVRPFGFPPACGACGVRKGTDRRAHHVRPPPPAP